MRRLMFLVALFASWAIAVAPAMAASTPYVRAGEMAVAPARRASTSHVRAREIALGATFDDMRYDAGGSLIPGTYFQTWVDGSHVWAVGDDPWDEAWACAGYSEMTIDAAGEWIDGSYFEGCGRITSLALKSNLRKGNLEASIPVEECVAWDEDEDECTESVVLGTIEVDLTVTGTGRFVSWHGTETHGVSGAYQFTLHARGSERAGVTSGTVTFEGASLLTGATHRDGWLAQTREGWAEITH